MSPTKYPDGSATVHYALKANVMREKHSPPLSFWRNNAKRMEIVHVAD